MKHAAYLLAGIFFMGINSPILSSMVSEYEMATRYLEERGEVYFRFYETAPSVLDKLTNVVSLDRVENSCVYAYANREEFEQFNESGIYYEVLTPPGLLTNPQMMTYTPGEKRDWDSYPDFNDYLSIMAEFETTYPDLCKVEEFGESVQGRKLLFAKVSDNVSEDEKEAEFLCTSSIHGDETLGYILMLRMIEYLCSNYPGDATVKEIVDNVELWICPLTNPDGTFAGGDNNISGARRYNANGRDLNRNFTDPEHIYGNYSRWENETKAMMDLEDQHNFTMGIDIHGGMETLVYPWAYTTQRARDEQWWIYVCENYAEIVWQNAPSSYLKTRTKGYGNAGIDFYVAPGTRIDGPYFRRHIRVLTTELNTEKLLAESKLEDHWDYNRDALLYLFGEALNGVSGTVTDSITNEPINTVKVFFENVDVDSTFTRSGVLGDYYRPIVAGNYSITFSHPEYQPKTVSNVRVVNGQPTILNVKLWDGSTGNNSHIALGNNYVSLTPYNHGFRIDYHMNDPVDAISIFTTTGRLLHTLKNGVNTERSFLWNGKDAHGQYLGKGCYIIAIQTEGKTLTRNFIIDR